MSAPLPVPTTSLQPLVLVVDDDIDIRHSMREVLEGEGYVVEEASNGRAALERLQVAPRPALVLLDLMMPVMDGQTLLAEIGARPELADLPIVVSTASAANEDSSTLRVPLLRKPFEIDALLRIVGQYSPRFWDDDEPPTEQTLLPPEPSNDTVRQWCAMCGAVAQARCTRCGQPFCRGCLDAGPDGACARCWRLAKGATGA